MLVRPAQSPAPARTKKRGLDCVVRASGQPEGGYGLPNRADCQDYNEWHYGLEDRNTYALRLTEEEIRERLVGRDVVYLAGSADTGDAALDMTCGAMLQGRHRFARALNLSAFMDEFYPENGHELVVVPGVGHSSTQIYQGGLGRYYLFNW